MKRILKLVLKETISEAVDWIHMAQNREQWQDSVNMVMKLQVPLNWGKYIIIYFRVTLYSSFDICEKPKILVIYIVNKPLHIFCTLCVLKHPSVMWCVLIQWSENLCICWFTLETTTNLCYFSTLVSFTCLLCFCKLLSPSGYFWTVKIRNFLKINT